MRNLLRTAWIVALATVGIATTSCAAIPPSGVTKDRLGNLRRDDLVVVDVKLPGTDTNAVLDIVKDYVGDRPVHSNDVEAVVGQAVAEVRDAVTAVQAAADGAAAAASSAQGAADAADAKAVAAQAAADQAAQAAASAHGAANQALSGIAEAQLNAGRAASAAASAEAKASAAQAAAAQAVSPVAAAQGAADAADAKAVAADVKAVAAQAAADQAVEAAAAADAKATEVRTALGQAIIDAVTARETATAAAESAATARASAESADSRAAAAAAAAAVSDAKAASAAEKAVAAQESAGQAMEAVAGMQAEVATIGPLRGEVGALTTNSIVVAREIADLTNYATNNFRLIEKAHERAKVLEAWQYASAITRTDIERGITDWVVLPTWPLGRVVVDKVSDGADAGKWAIFRPDAADRLASSAIATPVDGVVGELGHVTSLAWRGVRCSVSAEWTNELAAAGIQWESGADDSSVVAVFDVTARRTVIAASDARVAGIAEAVTAAASGLSRLEGECATNSIVVAREIQDLTNYATNNFAMVEKAHERAKDLEVWRYNSALCRADFTSGMAGWVVSPMWPFVRTVVDTVEADGQQLWSLFPYGSSVHSPDTALVPLVSGIPDQYGDVTVLAWPATQWPVSAQWTNELNSLGVPWTPGDGTNVVAVIDIVARRMRVPTQADIAGLQAGKYDRQSGGIPAGDLADGVRASLDRADASVQPMRHVAWEDLKVARGDGLLVPGQEYRITNYWATTNGDMESVPATNQFDIVVVADSTNVLNEVARAVRHEGDTYFPKSTKFEAWKLWYCLDNDGSRFEWALPDADGGRGVVYRMVDEFRNDVPYDFKGIKFIPWGATGTDHFYTFGTAAEDMSIYGLDYMVIGNCVGPHYRTGNPSQARRQKLNRIVFKSYTHVHNTVGPYSRNITIARYGSNNTFGPHCHDTVASGIQDVTVGAHCAGLSFSSFFGSFDLSFSTGAYHGASVGPHCSNSTIAYGSSLGAHSTGCTLGLGSHIGDNCTNVTVGDSSTVGGGCSEVYVGSKCSVGEGCRNIYVSADGTTIGPDCDHVYLVDRQVPLFDGAATYAVDDLVWYNGYLRKCTQAGTGSGAVFGAVAAGDLATPARWLTVGNGVRDVVLCATGGNLASTNRYQNVEVKSGVCGTREGSSRFPKIIVDTGAGQAFHTTYKPADSQELSVP